MHSISHARAYPTPTANLAPGRALAPREVSLKESNTSQKKCRICPRVGDGRQEVIHPVFGLITQVFQIKKMFLPSLTQNRLTSPP